MKEKKFALVPSGFGMRGEVMLQTYTAVVEQDANWWIGWVEEVPGVNCQEATREQLLDSLRVALAEAIAFNRIEARRAGGKY